MSKTEQSLREQGFSNSKNFHSTQCAYLRKVSSNRRKTADVCEFENSSSVAGEFSVSEQPKKINNNFFGIESDEGVIEINDKPSLNNNVSRQLFKNVEQEKFISTTFGTVRYDSENKPKYHGQLEKEKILISSAVEKDKIHDLNQTLLSKNSVQNCSFLSNTQESSKRTTDVLDRNLKSELPSSSHVDELYFPESYTVNENNTTVGLENSSSCSKEEKSNFIEESYFTHKMNSDTIFQNTDITSEAIKSTECNVKQATSEVESSPFLSFDNKSNFIEECYFNDKITDETVIKNSDMRENMNTDENHSILIHNKCISDDKQSSYIDDSYFNSICDGNFKNVHKKFQSVTKVVDTVEEKSNKENSMASDAQNKVLKKNLLINESEVGMTDSQVTSKEVKFSTKGIFNSQETETNMKTLYNLDKNIENLYTNENSVKLSSEFINPNLEELEDYNKFISRTTHLSKIKNNFSFQSKEFLKKSRLINSKSYSSEKKLRSFQRKLGETDSIEETHHKEEQLESSQEMHDIKVKKEACFENLNANDQPESAYHFVKKLRSAKKKLDPELINGKFIQKTEQYDSKGFRILKNQVPDLKYYTRDEILELLIKNVLYSDDDLVVLNKPYNLVMHESKTVKDPCLSQYLDDLAAELDKKTYKPKLITVHRLDKETSGCLLLARNEISAQRLLSFFSQRKIIKTYWIVTIKVPNPLEGVIDMPISEGSINGRARMVLHPDLPKDVSYQNHSKSGKRAVTHYKVISESGNAALVEAKPETGIKHQIRVHFGFGLSCPILGDHKYSHLDKLAPQKLQSDLLQKLHVRQSKVRHIPMHIYARSILIPQYRDGRNLFVMAPMPIHMSKNLQRLKFKKK
ncbi:Mitochondrial RNA pseudouridine synthase like protein [Argiope bruennichi]|uniref:Pseudouridylate synthase RPUSD4, mitochondrial n=1 Tax=Argiope bruennichi TaxID=94029 RepID=A0A8T0FTD3_ARGBR|nr:Mitochondrial RNA pseudouridine synthase like protein [Argiope bruennichi]